jgi:serine/threonine protein kinase
MSDHSLAMQRIVRYGLALAVEYLHTNGHSHGEIKPDSVLLDSHGRPCLSAFAYAKQFQVGWKITSSLRAIAFGAPEDIVSLGMTSAAVLIGRQFKMRRYS